MAELLTNAAVENAAIEFVVSLERGAGRDPVDVRRTRNAGDIVSPPRTIEVKASDEAPVELTCHSRSLNLMPPAAIPTSTSTSSTMCAKVIRSSSS